MTVDCPKCGKHPVVEYTGLCSWCYNDSSRDRYYADGDSNGEWWVMREIPGNNIPIGMVCTTHGQPDAEMIVDALNFWQDRHKREVK